MYVVDNNSPTPLGWTSDPDMTVIRNTSRHSVSGLNFGFYHSLYKSGRNHEYVVNIDNDVICKENWLDSLVKEMEGHPNTGVCGGKQWKKEDKDFYSVGSDLTGYIYRSQPTERTEVHWLQGSFHMYRADMMRRIGLHDTRFQDYCSDSD